MDLRAIHLQDQIDAAAAEANTIRENVVQSMIRSGGTSYRNTAPEMIAEIVRRATMAPACAHAHAMKVAPCAVTVLLDQNFALCTACHASNLAELAELATMTCDYCREESEDGLFYEMLMPLTPLVTVYGNFCARCRNHARKEK